MKKITFCIETKKNHIFTLTQGLDAGIIGDWHYPPFRSTTMTEKTTSAQASALEPKAKISGKVVKTTLAGVLVDIGQ